MGSYNSKTTHNYPLISKNFDEYKDVIIKFYTKYFNISYIGQCNAINDDDCYMCLDNKLTYNPYFSPEYLSNNFIFDNATNSRNIMLYSDMNDFINAYIHYRSNAIIKKYEF